MLALPPRLSAGGHGWPRSSAYHGDTVHRRAGQEGAESADGSQQLGNTDCGNRNRAARVFSPIQMGLLGDCFIPKNRSSQQFSSLPRRSRNRHHCCRKTSRQREELISPSLYSASRFSSQFLVTVPQILPDSDRELLASAIPPWNSYLSPTGQGSSCFRQGKAFSDATRSSRGGFARTLWKTLPTPR